MPRSSARATRTFGSSCSPHQSEPSAQVPKPTADVTRSVSPKRRECIAPILTLGLRADPSRALGRDVERREPRPGAPGIARLGQLAQLVLEAGIDRARGRPAAAGAPPATQRVLELGDLRGRVAI